MCHGVLCLVNGVHCECDTASPDVRQKCKDERASQNLGKLTSDIIAGLQYTSFRVTSSIEEINYVDCNAELAIAHQCMSTIERSEEKKSVNDNTETDHECARLDPYCGAGTFVMETADKVTTVSNCSEMELVQNIEEIDTTITMCYECSPTTMNKGEIYSEEESVAVNITNKDFHLGSQTRTTPQKSGFTLDEELSKGVMSFASNDDGTSRNEATFGVLSSNRRDFNYSNNSLRAKIVGKSGLAGAYYATDKTHTLPDNQLTLPNPVANSSDDPIKKLVTGM